MLDFKPQFIVWLMCFFSMPLSVAVAGQDGEHNLDHIVLQLEWKNQFEFAGYYMAKEKGFYAQAGLDVEIREASNERTPIKEVMAGQAQYGVEGGGLILEFLNGKPLVAIYAVFQRSPAVWIVPENSDIHNFTDLATKRLEVNPFESVEVEHIAPFILNGINIHKLNYSPLSYGVEDLISGRVDGLAGYRTNQPYLLKKRGFKYRLMDPAVAGVEFYGGMLFTSTQEVDQHFERVVAMKNASLLGWQYAISHVDEAIDTILTKYNPDKSREQLEFEAEQFIDLILPELVSLGYINPFRIKQMAEIQQKVGMTLAKIENYDDFVFDENKLDISFQQYENEKRKMIVAAFIAVAVLISFVIVAGYFYRLSKRLKGLKRELEYSLRRDPLTGLTNRLGFVESIQHSIAFAQRYHRPLSLIIADIDFFKRINDEYGHPIGDMALCHFSSILQHAFRQQDIVSRVGGEEFCICLPETGLQEAVMSAERFRLLLKSMPLHVGETITIDITASLGCAEFDLLHDSFDTLYSKADKQLYEAKNCGRDQVRPLI